jgi:hypothetical protein
MIDFQLEQEFGELPTLVNGRFQAGPKYENGLFGLDVSIKK